MIQVYSGYSGGHTDYPTYEQVCSGSTGHAEVVEVSFDNKSISLAEILSHYFTLHDPTQANGQGADRGSQYRSCIFYSTTEQRLFIDKALKQEQEKYKNPLVTELKQDQFFWKAEEYHQCYIEKRQNNLRP